MDLKNLFTLSTRNIFRVFTFCMLATTVACTSEELTEQTTDPDGPITFTTSINGSAATRAYDDTWEEDDVIGVFMHGASGAFDKDYYKANREYVIDGTPDDYKTVTFIPKDGNELYYPADANTSVYFTAYYPYDDTNNFIENEELGELPIDVTDQSVQKKIDLLYATFGSYNRATADAYAIPGVKFNHKLSKVIIKIALDESMKKADGWSLIDSLSMKVTIKGIPTIANFKLKDATFDLTSATKSNIVTLKDSLFNYKGVPGDTGNSAGGEKGRSAVHEAIIIPHNLANQSSYDDRTIEFEFKTVDNIDETATFVYTIPSTDDASYKVFASGMSTTYNFTLKRNAIELAGVSIIDWGKEADVSADVNDTPAVTP